MIRPSSFVAAFVLVLRVLLDSEHLHLLGHLLHGALPVPTLGHFKLGQRCSPVAHFLDGQFVREVQFFEGGTQFQSSLAEDPALLEDLQNVVGNLVGVALGTLVRVRRSTGP